MPRRIPHDKPTKRMRVRAGRKKESLRAKRAFAKTLRVIHWS